MELAEVLKKFDGIIETDDKNVASQKIVEFKEYLTTESGRDIADNNAQCAEIARLSDEVARLVSENEEIRKANTEILLKYGAAVDKIAQNAGDYIPPPSNEPKCYSWGEIAKLD